MFILKLLMLWSAFPLRVALPGYSGAQAQYPTDLSETCPMPGISPQRTFLNYYPSVCHLSQTFYNKENGWSTVDTTLTVANRKASITPLNEKAGDFLAEFFSAQHTILKGVSNEIFTKWFNFLNSLIEVVELGKLRNHNLGFCGEAARHSIASSLWDQVQTGQRESVFLVSIESDKRELDHSFVVYNAKSIPSSKIANGDIDSIIKNLQRDNQHRSIIICDSWTDYHGPANKWYDTYAKDPASQCDTVTWKRMESTNFSIPSLRDGLDDKQRTYLKEKMTEILSDIFPKKSAQIKHK